MKTTRSRIEVLVGGASPLPVSFRSEVRKLKGYAKSRVDYDARRRLNIDTPLTSIFKRVLRFDPCAFCPAGRQVMDVDHIQPLSSGGSDSWPNMTAACKSCNRGRREQPVLHFMLRRLA